MKYIGKLLPIEGYIVLLKGELPGNYAQSLTHLYQPLIGVQAVALYQTLLHEIEIQQNTPQTHHSLMNYLNMPLDEIYRSRLKLEGIGLLKTFENKAENNNHYTYQLRCPFAPSAFFNDAMLSQLLYHQLGEGKFTALKAHYSNVSVSVSGTNVTASFTDVFHTFHAKSAPDDNNNNSSAVDKISTNNLDWLKQMLRQRFIPEKKLLVPENTSLVQQMMLLYDLAEYEVEKAFLWALTDENKLDTDEFKSACLDMFQSKNSQQVIKLTEKINQQKTQQNVSKPATKEEQLIYQLENMSPRQLLEDLSSGNRASSQDLKIISEVMTAQGLKAPVMNVLIHYVLLQSNMKLSKAYLEKIASHWSRANLQTAKEAMLFAKKETQRFKQGNTKKNSYRKPVSNEIIPDWFQERKAKQPDTGKQLQPETEQDKEKFAQLFQEFTGNSQK